LTRRQYHRQLEAALLANGRFGALAADRSISGAEALSVISDQ
jgi:hypothetical protein